MGRSNSQDNQLGLEMLLNKMNARRRERKREKLPDKP